LRPSPTAYDPRTRPWYILAKEHPGRVVRTDPYQSVTSPDLNIGIDTAMVLPNGTVSGVIGADITLVDLTKYVTEFNFGRDVQIVMVNETGTVLAAKDPSLLYNNISRVTGNQTTTLLQSSEGMLALPQAYLIYYTSPHLGWKYAVIIPFYQIEKELSESIITILIFVFVALILLSVITLLALNHTVIKPISTLTSIATNISETGQLNHSIPTNIEGEIGELSKSFNSMITAIKLRDEANLKANDELSQYRDHLSEIVRERTSQLETANLQLQDQRDELEQINSELQTAKQRAEDMDRLKSAFLATMSHELRTPLNSIIGFTGIILQGLAGPLTTEQHKQLNLVKHSAAHLLALINDVLDISKIEAGELKISREPVDIVPSIISVIKTIQPLADQKGLIIETDLRVKEAFVIGDQRRIEQIILNLLSNAVKFTDTGSIQINNRVENDTVFIAIRDSGIGINPEDIDTLFQPFHQIDTGTTRKHEGTGLGLSICKKLVQLHNGTITVTSEVGKGSTFTLSFPEKRNDSN
ncbi:MAG: ATP-binding protein, partial [Methanospirillum sp.]|uniref:sensor histidine kinase n=1 Tax=Methanospirillum sp. TaxID=45200 RepID=UPI00236AC915